MRWALHDAVLSGCGERGERELYKRCSSCGRNVTDRLCGTCGTSNTNWAYRTYIDKDADGKWIEERRGGFATKREAERR